MVFKTLDDCYEYAYSSLEDSGYFNDESSGLEQILQHNSKTVIKVMEEKGYKGNLQFAGGFYPNRGALYWIFDEDKLSYDEARKLTEKWINS